MYLFWWHSGILFNITHCPMCNPVSPVSTSAGYEKKHNTKIFKLNIYIINYIILTSTITKMNIKSQISPNPSKQLYVHLHILAHIRMTLPLVICRQCHRPSIEMPVYLVGWCTQVQVFNLLCFLTYYIIQNSLFLLLSC